MRNALNNMLSKSKGHSKTHSINWKSTINVSELRLQWHWHYPTIKKFLPWPLIIGKWGIWVFVVWNLAGLMIFKLMFGFYIGFNDCSPNLDYGVIEQDLHAWISKIGVSLDFEFLLNFELWSPESHFSFFLEDAPLIHFNY